MKEYVVRIFNNPQAPARFQVGQYVERDALYPRYKPVEGVDEQGNQRYEISHYCSAREWNQANNPTKDLEAQPMARVFKLMAVGSTLAQAIGSAKKLQRDLKDRE